MSYTLGFGPTLGNFTGGFGGAPQVNFDAYDSGQQGSFATSVTINATLGLIGNLSSAVALHVNWYDLEGTALAISDSGTLHPGASSSYAWTFTPPPNATRALIDVFGALPGGTTGTAQVDGTIDFGDPFCLYGTELQGGAPTAVYLTLDMVRQWASSLVSGKLAWLALPFVGLAYDLQYLCSHPRPVPNPAQGGGLILSIDAGALVQALLWDQFCH